MTSLALLAKAAGAPELGVGVGSAEARVADAAQVTLETWRKRGLEGTVNLGESEMPATLAADIVLLELLVHAWDFAVATGQSLSVDDELSAYVLERARGVIAPQMRDGDVSRTRLSPGRTPITSPVWPPSPGEDPEHAT